MCPRFGRLLYHYCIRPEDLIDCGGSEGIERGTVAERVRIS